jgi:hypothetical protein
MLVYDFDQTDGPPLPKALLEFAEFEGSWNPTWLSNLIKNAAGHRIRVDFKSLSSTNAGFATLAAGSGNWKMRIAIHKGLNGPSRFGVLCHELAHILLGHLGAPIGATGLRTGPHGFDAFDPQPVAFRHPSFSFAPQRSMWSNTKGVVSSGPLGSRLLVSDWGCVSAPFRDLVLSAQRRPRGATRTRPFGLARHKPIKQWSAAQIAQR